MKNKTTLRITTAAFACLLLSGCGDEEVDARQTEEISGLIYKASSDEPFTGIVKNYPITVAGVMSLGMCNMPIKNGLPDRTAECFTNSGVKISEITFSEGLKNGKETTWNHKTQKIQEEREWLSGKMHGEQKKYSPDSGGLIHLIVMNEGKPDGIEKAWSPDGETLITDLVWRNGKQSGKFTFADRVEHYLDGELHGEQIFFTVHNGPQPYTYKRSVNSYEKGSKVTEKTYDNLGNLTFEGQWKNGVPQSTLTQKWEDGKIVERSHLINTDPNWSDQWNEPPMVKNGEEKYYATLEDYYHVTWDMGHPIKGSFKHSSSDGKIIYEYEGTPTADRKGLLKNGTELYMYSNASEIKKLEWDNGALNSEIPPQATPDFFKQSGCNECLRRALTQLEYSQRNSSNHGESCYTEKLNEIQEENPNFPISFDMMNEMRAECGLPAEE